MYISLKGMGLFASALLLTTSANAEYYLVYPDTMAVCSSGCQRVVSCRTACCSSIAMILHYHDRWRSHTTNKVNRYRIEQLSDTSCATSSCCSMQPIRHSGHEGEIMKMRYDSGPARVHYVNTNIDPYYPDMATGDDEIMTDSDMNNQY